MPCFDQVSDFESLPSSVGRFSTKFWLRDYEQFVAQDPEDVAPPLDDLAAFEGFSPPLIFLEISKKFSIDILLVWSLKNS